MWNADVPLARESVICLINDRFHLIKCLNHGTDEVIRLEVRQCTERLDGTIQEVKTVGWDIENLRTSDLHFFFSVGI